MKALASVVAVVLLMSSASTAQGQTPAPVLEEIVRDDSTIEAEGKERWDQVRRTSWVPFHVRGAVKLKKPLWARGCSALRPVKFSVLTEGRDYNYDFTVCLVGPHIRNIWLEILDMPTGSNTEQPDIRRVVLTPRQRMTMVKFTGHIASRPELRLARPDQE